MLCILWQLEALSSISCSPMCVVVVVVVVVEIIKLYLVQPGHFLATTSYVALSPHHVQNNVQKRS